MRLRSPNLIGPNMERLIEAQRAVLERALVLEKEGGNNPAEGQALQEAADFLREMKLNTQSDGMGNELTSGDKDFILDRQD